MFRSVWNVGVFVYSYVRQQHERHTRMKWIPIFKTGTHTSMGGSTRTYSEADLDNMVTLYNEQPENDKRLAPHVLGHPTTDAPSYGWVRQLQRVGDMLYAACDQMNEQFVEAVNKGMYKFRSASFYNDGRLRHVGWLGGTQPAIAGLGEVHFASDEDTDVFEFGEDYYDWTIEDAFTQTGVALANLRDWLIEKESLEVADRIIPTYYVDSIKRVKLPKWEPPVQPMKDESSFSEPTEQTATGNPETDPTNSLPPNKETSMDTNPNGGATGNANTTGVAPVDFSEQMANMETMQKAAHARISTLEAENQRMRDELAKSQFTAFCEGLVTANKMLPTEVDFYVSDLMMKSRITDFAEGQSPVEITKQYLEGRAPHALFSEAAGKNGRTDGTTTTIPSHLPAGVQVDAESIGHRPSRRRLCRREQGVV